jgi:hypothetical protein
MKITNVVLVLVLALGLVGFVGCKKKDTTTTALQPMEVQGVKVDLPKLQAAADATTNAELQSSVRNVLMSFRYGQYEKALMEMDKVANDPNLPPDQKQLANQVLEQVKEVNSKAPPPAQ